MGTDIHAHVEVKLHGRWLHYGAPHVDRNYDLFTCICSVRGEDSDIEPVTEPKRFPDDASEITKMIYDYDGGPEYTHSAGWLTRSEMRKVAEWYETREVPHRQGSHHGFEGVFGYLCGNPLYSDDQKLFEDVRIVFWFDN
jgi:hypothetical protein